MLLLLGQDVLEGPYGDVPNPLRGFESDALRRRLLGLLGRAARLAVRRRGWRCGRATRRATATAAPPGPVAGLRRAAGAALARRRRRCGASIFASIADADGRRADAPAGLAGGRGRGRRHAPRAVLDRPAPQPHAGLRGADGAAGRRPTRSWRCSRGLLVGRLGADGRRSRRSPPRWRSCRCATGSQTLVDRRFARARFEAVRLLRDFLEDVRDGRAEPEDVGAVRRARARRPERGGRSSGCPRRAPTPTATGHVVEALPDDGREHADRSVGRELGVLLHAPPAPRRTCCAACSTPPRCRSSWRACASSCGCSWPRWSPRARGSRRPATRSGGGSSATCTTARSSGW